MGHGIFADYNGIIDDNAQGHDQAKQADHVDRAAVQIQHPQCRQERGGNTHRHPAGSRRVEKKVQDQDHQDKPTNAVFQQ